MLLINRSHLLSMINDAREVHEECCGFLFGRQVKFIRKITYILPVGNSSLEDKRYRFEISPKDYLYAEELADQHGLQLLGVYHSHINAPPIPSETDSKNAWPCLSYVIFSMHNGHFSEMRSWQLNDELQFREESLKIEQQ